MKNLKNVIAGVSLFLIALMGASCKSYTRVDSIYVDGKIEEFAIDGSTQHVKLLFNQSWNANVGEDWLVVSPRNGAPKTAGKLDSVVVTLVAKRNETGAARLQAISFNTDNAYQNITIKQN